MTTATKRKPRATVEVWTMPDSVSAALGMSNLIVQLWHAFSRTELQAFILEAAARAADWCEFPDESDCPETDAESLRTLVELHLAHEAVNKATLGYTAATIDIRASVVHREMPE